MDAKPCKSECMTVQNPLCIPSCCAAVLTRGSGDVMRVMRFWGTNFPKDLRQCLMWMNVSCTLRTSEMRDDGTSVPSNLSLCVWSICFFKYLMGFATRLVFMHVTKTASPKRQTAAMHLMAKKTEMFPLVSSSPFLTLAVKSSSTTATTTSHIMPAVWYGSRLQPPSGPMFHPFMEPSRRPVRTLTFEAKEALVLSADKRLLPATVKDVIGIRSHELYFCRSSCETAAKRPVVREPVASNLA
mmetsp:Transcript_10467/g.25719  ORF Transcript_10467/g.25719 Transcript_10467/m.25719 type:complete len:242 (+) Transcript_10467:904-1629(+)